MYKYLFKSLLSGFWGHTSRGEIIGPHVGNFMPFFFWWQALLFSIAALAFCIPSSGTQLQLLHIIVNSRYFFSVFPSFSVVLSSTFYLFFFLSSFFSFLLSFFLPCTLNSHLNVCEITSHCDFDLLQFPSLVITYAKHLFMCFGAIRISFEKRLSKSIADILRWIVLLSVSCSSSLHVLYATVRRSVVSNSLQPHDL